MAPGSSSHPDYSAVEGFSHFYRRAYFGAISWRVYQAVLLFLVILTFVCSRIAMLNILGYEFSAVIALFVCHFTAALAIREFDSLRDVLAHRSPFSPGPHPRLVVWGVVLGSMAASGWLLLVPLVGIVLLDLVFGIRNCDPLKGLGFYLTIPLISSFFSASLGAWCALTTSTRRKAGWLYVLILAIFVARVAIRIGRGHTIGLNDPFLGTLDLPLYDQEANLASGFLFSRLFLLTASVFIATVSCLLADSRFQKYGLWNIFRSLRRVDAFLPEIQAALVTAVLLILGFYYQGPLGMEVTRRYVEHVLNGRVETDHFILRYPKGSEVEDNIERVAEEHEFYYWSIVNEIKVAPKGKIRAYIYPSRKMKTTLTGVGSSVYAKPWTSEIHVEFDPNRIWALKHELVHVISAPMGLRFFGSSVLGAYGEGIAEGVYWETDNALTQHQWAAALREAQDPLTDKPFFPRDTAPLELLTRNFRPGGFYVGRIGMNYYLAASHSRWFLDTYGPEAYALAYVRDDTSSAIGMTQEAEAQAWMEYLDHVPLRREEILSARLGFAAPKFVVRVCAHELAEHERLAEEAVQRSVWTDACDEYEILLDYSPRNIRYGYEEAKVLYRDDKFEEALSLVASMRQWESADEGWQTYLTVLEGDIYTRSGQPSMAFDKYSQAIQNSLTTSFRESIMLRIAVLNSPAREEFLAALQKPDEARWRFERARALDSSWLPLYYLGTDLIGDRMYKEAEEMFLECLRLDPPYPFVRRTILYDLGVCAYRNKEYSLARRDFQEASAIAANIFMQEHPSYDGFIPLDRLDSWSHSCSEWLSRCDWREGWAGLPTNPGAQNK